MAIQFNTTANGLARTTGLFLSTGSDFTVMFWVQCTKPIGNTTDYRTAWILGDDTFAAGYTWIGSSIGATAALSDNFDLQTQNNVPVTSFTIEAQQIPTIWAHVAATYDHTTHIASFFMNGSLIGSATAVDLSAVTFAAERLGFDATGAVSNIGFAYYRSFQAKLTADQIKAEMRSASAVASTPFCDTPLTGPSDLADVSGNSRNWSLIGVASLLAGPVFIASITNIDANSAQDIGTLPVTIVQNVRDTTTHDVWFKYTAQPGDNEIGVFAFGDLSVYKPTVIVWVGPTSSLVTYHFGFDAQNKPLQMPIEAAYSVYYFQVQTNSSSASPANLIISALQGPSNSPSIANILIVDDTNFLPAGLVSNVDGTPKAFIQGIVNSENGDVLSNGNILLINSGSATETADLILYDFKLVKIIGITLSGSNLITANRTTNKFWVVQGGEGSSNPKLYNVSSVGILSALIATITTTNFIVDISVSIDDKIAYYVIGSPYAVKRWDLVNNVAMSDFLGTRTGYSITNRQSLLVLSDGTIVVSYSKNSDKSISILRYNAAGTLLNTYDFTDILDNVENTLICSMPNDPITFLVWEHLSTHISRFRIVTVATGASTFADGYQFSSGVYNYNATIAPLARFGSADSCPVLVMRSAPMGGIYKIVPLKRDDTLFDTGVVKIPDPFFKTGLIGG